MLNSLVDELIVLGHTDLAEVISKTEFSDDTKKSILHNLHLTGTMGKCGAMKKKDRLDLLKILIKYGYLDKNGIKLTKKGIDYSSDYDGKI